MLFTMLSEVEYESRWQTHFVVKVLNCILEPLVIVPDFTHSVSNSTAQIVVPNQKLHTSNNITVKRDLRVGLISLRHTRQREGAGTHYCPRSVNSNTFFSSASRTPG